MLASLVRVAPICPAAGWRGFGEVC